MKIITIVAQQISAQALAAALPTEGVSAVTVTETKTFNRTATAVESYRGRKIPQHFSTVHRVELAVEDEALQAVTDGIAFARSAGLLGDAKAWVTAESAVDLFASHTTSLGMSA
jgi:nitrogen regulatory protein PII